MERDIEGTIVELCSNAMQMIDDLDSGRPVPRPMPVERLKNWARESYQDLYRDRVLSICRKLKLGEELSPDEAGLAEEWMVGDLELYQGAEGHAEEWKDEMAEVCQSLLDLAHGGVNGDAKSLLRIQAEVIEIEHLLQDLDRYRSALDRIKRYRAFIGRDINSLKKEEKVRLADLLRAMVYSADM
jgi:hypothetical protein